MSKPEFSKPFNLDHAKTGAPYCCRDGEEAIILKWDGRRFNEPLVGCIGADDVPASWGGDGRYVPDENCPRPRDLVMLPVGMCQSKPAFMGDELVTRFGDKFVVEAKHIGDLDEENTWPPSYPVTQMRLEDFDAAIIESGSKECISASAACAIANAALIHAIDAGQVALPDATPSDDLLMKVAVAVQLACSRWTATPTNDQSKFTITQEIPDLASIIAIVTGTKDAKEGAK